MDNKQILNHSFPITSICRQDLVLNRVLDSNEEALKVTDDEMERLAEMIAENIWGIETGFNLCELWSELIEENKSCGKKLV